MTNYAHWFAIGAQFYQARRYSEALLPLIKAVELNPHAVQALCYLGEIWVALGRYGEAADVWTKAIRWQPAAFEAQMGLGVLAERKGNMAEAASYYRRASLLSQDSVSAKLGMARIDFIYGRYEQAMQLARDALTIIPTSVEAWEITYNAHIAMGNNDAARSDLLAYIVNLPITAKIIAAAIEQSIELEQYLTLAVNHLWKKSERNELRRILFVLTTRQTPLIDGRVHTLYQQYTTLSQCCRLSGSPVYWPRRTKSDRLRIGYITTASTENLVPIMSSHEIGYHAVYCYWFGAADDPLIKQLASKEIALRVCSGIPLQQVARLIGEEDIDVLIDCVGLRELFSADLLAYRPARIGATLIDVGCNFSTEFSSPWIQYDDDYLHKLDLLAAHTSEVSATAAELKQLWQQAVLKHQQGQYAEAEVAYKALMEIQPEYAPTYYMMGMLYRDRDSEIAQKNFSKAMALAADFVEARVARANMLIAEHHYREALQLCEEALPEWPEHIELLVSAAHAAQGEQQVDRACEWLLQALKFKPTQANLYFDLGVCYQKLGRKNEAENSYQLAILFSADYIDAIFNLGALYHEGDDINAAASCYQRVLSLAPDHVSSYKNLGEIYLATGQITDWLNNFLRFERQCPSAMPLAVYTLEAALHLGDLRRIDHYLEGIIQERFTPRDELELIDCLEQLLYLLLFFDVDPEHLHAFYRTYDKAARHVYGSPFSLPLSRREGKVRIGYISGDLRNHVMGRMIYHWLQYHNRTRFEIFCYGLNKQQDHLTEQIRSVVDHYIDLAAEREEGAARRIAKDDIDLLVDCSTHTKGAKPGILAFKPARVIITHIASAGAVGLSTIDFKLTDQYADLEENRNFQIEKMLVMQGCVYPFSCLTPSPNHNYRREEYGVSREAIVIGAFVNLLKLSRRCLYLWKEVLDRLPQAVLALSPNIPAMRASYVRLFKNVGVEEQRLLFIPYGSSEAENLARYCLVDLVLDPMPFGGVNGTLEAISMAVPVVSLCGKKHGERSTYSILMNLGVTQTIAHNGNDYVAIACRLATEPNFMQEVRMSIHKGLIDSPLVDAQRYTCNLEAAYDKALAETHPQWFPGD